MMANGFLHTKNLFRLMVLSVVASLVWQRDHSLDTTDSPERCNVKQLIKDYSQC